MTNLCSYEYQDYNTLMNKMYPCYVVYYVQPFYYVQLLYIHIMFKKCQKNVKIILIRGQKQKNKYCEDENILFYFLGTIIIIRYIYKDEKLI